MWGKSRKQFVNKMEAIIKRNPKKKPKRNSGVEKHNN